MLRLPFLRAASAFGAAVLSRRDRTVRADFPASGVSWDGVPDWEPYIKAKGSKSHRRHRRQLQEIGELRSGEVLDLASRRETFDWMVRRKLAWLDRAGHADSALRNPRYIEFLKEQASAPRRENGVRIYRMTCGDTLVAAELATVGNGVLEMQVAAYASEFEKYSAGALLTEEVLKAAFDERLFVDLRIGPESWKGRWATEDTQVYAVEVTGGPLRWIHPLYRRVHRLLSRNRAVQPA